MRQKIAKKIRRAAREATVGYPDVAYDPEKLPRWLDHCTRSMHQQIKAAYKDNNTNHFFKR